MNIGTLNPKNGPPGNGGSSLIAKSEEERKLITKAEDKRAALECLAQVFGADFCSKGDIKSVRISAKAIGIKLSDLVTFIEARRQSK